MTKEHKDALRYCSSRTKRKHGDNKAGQIDGRDVKPGSNHSEAARYTFIYVAVLSNLLGC